MSLQKVVSNYFNDMLDFLASKYRKNNGDLTKFFATARLQDKKEVLDKIAAVYTRLDILNTAQERFWQSKISLYKAYQTILIILILITFVAIIYFVKWEVSHGELTSIEVFKTYFTYIIVFLVFFAVYVLLLVNVGKLMDKAKNMKHEAWEQLWSFRKMMGFSDVYIKDFMFIGLKSMGNTSTSTCYKLDNTHIQPYIQNYGTDDKKTGKCQGKPLMDSIALNYDGYFDNYRGDIQAALISFYDNGHGYVKIKQKLIASSNILIFQELNLVLKYYYKMLTKKQNKDAMLDNTELTNTLDRFVVQDLSLVFNMTANPSERLVASRYNITSGHEKDIPPPEKLIEGNLADAEFSKQFGYLKRCFTLVSLYLYQVYIKKQSNEIDFDGSIKLLLPHELNTGAMQKDVEFYTTMKNKFAEHALNKLVTAVATAKTSTSLKIIYDSVMVELKPILDNIYITTLFYIQGNYDFPFDWSYMDKPLQDDFAEYTKNIASTDKNMFGQFKSEQFQVIRVCLMESMATCYTTYNESMENPGALKQALVARIAANIAKFNIKVMDNSKYVIEKVESINKTKSSADSQSAMMEAIAAIDQDVAQRKLGGLNPNNSNDYKYIEPDQFVSELDKITYNDLKVGLNYAYVNTILNEFYMSVSTESNTAGLNGTSKDIYFTMRKNLLLGKMALFFIGTITVLCILYHIVMMFNEWSDMNEEKDDSFLPEKLEGMSKGQIDALKHDYLDAQVNMGVKAFLPIAGAIFVLCLLISIYLKSEAKFNFNRNIIDTNTSDLRSAFQDLFMFFDELDDQITGGLKNGPIANIPVFDVEHKTKLYKVMKKIVDKYEKCNYVLNASKVEFPFPYGEVIVDATMIVVVLGSLLFVYGKIEPLRRIKEIKVLNSMIEQAKYSESDPAFMEEIEGRAGCHDAEIDNIMFTLKLLFFMSIIMFLVFYSSKVISSASDFEAGIYNSVFFEESTCLD